MGALDGVRLARRFGVPAMVIPRHRLLQRLAEGMASDCLRFAHTCREVRHHKWGATLEFENGDSATVDLVIGADGYRSAVRTAVLGGGPAEPTGWAEWQGLSQISTRLTHGHESLSLTDKNGACGLMPAGEGMLQWWFAVPWAPNDPRPSSVISMLRERFGSWMPPVPELLDAVSDAEVNFWPYVRHRVPKSLVVGRVVLLGDAVHAMPPTMSQGANQTLEDAMVLTAQLRAAPLSRALRGYDRARRRRVAVVSRLAARSPAQNPDAAWVRSFVVPATLSTWFFGSLLRAVSNSL
jgi:FAD-dependent urate hydroxylase